jgi:hypothetical protein
MRGLNAMTLDREDEAAGALKACETGGNYTSPARRLPSVLPGSGKPQ